MVTGAALEQNNGHSRYIAHLGALDGLALQSWVRWYLCKDQKARQDSLAGRSRSYPVHSPLVATGVPSWAASARFDQALWGENLAEPPKSSPQPHRSLTLEYAENTDCGTQ